MPMFTRFTSMTMTYFVRRIYVHTCTYIVCVDAPWYTSPIDAPNQADQDRSFGQCQLLPSDCGDLSLLSPRFFMFVFFFLKIVSKIPEITSRNCRYSSIALQANHAWSKRRIPVVPMSAISSNCSSVIPMLIWLILVEVELVFCSSKNVQECPTQAPCFDH